MANGILNKYSLARTSGDAIDEGDDHSTDRKMSRTCTSDD